MVFTKERIIALTLALYRVTELMPENEALRQKMRESASDILADLVCSEPERAAENIDLLMAYFQMAIAQDWLDEKNFLVLRREYEDIKREIRGFVKPEAAAKAQKTEKRAENPGSKAEKTFSLGGVPSGNSRKKRQERILELMGRQGEIALEELKSEFSQVCPRTLRRDMVELAEKGLIHRVRKSKKDVLYLLSKEDKVF